MARNVLLALFAVACTATDLLQEGLEADDACDASGSEGCSLELRQLRAKQLAANGAMATDASSSAAVESAKEGVESFGEHAIGQDMWETTTWNDIVAAVQANITARGGNSMCNRDTGGTCMIRSCKDSRGPTRCSSDYKCQCETGYCALEGQCFPMDSSHCHENTGGTCSIFPCSGSRGDTKCKSGQCICKTGGCAYNGKCYPVVDTGGTCHIMGCASSRGPTTCHNGRCLCTSGHVSVQGVCVQVR
mmetsp:Transcript_41575/g.62824  ORF Transcript_41575/g.62824 Transcript_41575/m.62824 type:complete len:247 (-) Transcript_41575:341-1081(-)